MAAKKEKETVEIPEGYVEISVPRAGAREDQNLFIGVNGVSYLIPTGKKSVVPDFVAAEYYRSLDAQDALYDAINELEYKE